MGLTDRLNRLALDYLRPARSAAYPYSMDDYLSWVSTAGAMFPMYGMGKGTLTQPNEEPPDGSYEFIVRSAYRANGAVFAVQLARLMLFKEVRFLYQRIRDGVPGDLFGGRELAVLEQPWPGATTGDLLGRMLLDADLGGTSIVARRGTRIEPLRPDRCIIIGPDPHSTEVLGVAYYPDGIKAGVEPEVLLRDEVAVFVTSPDPMARFRGISWVTPIINEVLGDKAITQHKLDFFRNGATVNQVVTFDPGITPAMFNEWVDLFEKAHANKYGRAFKTLYLGAGAKFDKVGSTPSEIDLKAIQGAGETRIAAAGRVPPIIVGFAEGLASATYSNYGMARRAFADLWARPTWRDAAGALQAIVPTDRDARLWYDDRQIPFLQEDIEDAARIRQLDSASIRTLVDAGFDPETVVSAIVSGDLRVLSHLGVYSVQLQPANSASPDAADAGRALASLIAPHLPKPPEMPALPAPDTKRAIERARAELIEQGIVRPTQAQVAEHLGVSDRTVRRWESEAA